MVSMLGSLAILVANADDHPEQAGHRLRLCAAAPMPPDTDRIWQRAVRLRDVQRAATGSPRRRSSRCCPRASRTSPARRASPTTHEFDVRLVDDDDVEVAGRRDRRDRVPARRART